MVRLRHHVRTLWPHTHPDPPLASDALEILHRIRKGKTGGFCGNFTVVYVQCCAAMGLHARQVGVQWEEGGGHSVSEVWSDQLGRWAVMDVDFDNHYVRDGMPLNALELHNAWVRGETAGIEKLEGGACPYPRDILGMYHYISIRMSSNLMTGARPGAPRVPHPSIDWVDADAPLRSPERSWTDRAEDLYWPLNQVEVNLEATDRRGVLRLHLRTFTPGFRDFQIRVDGGEWESLQAQSQDGETASAACDWEVDTGPLEVRARNVRGVCGKSASVSKAA
jgi:hypothetical protein